MYFEIKNIGTRLVKKRTRITTWGGRGVARDARRTRFGDFVNFRTIRGFVAHTELIRSTAEPFEYSARSCRRYQTVWIRRKRPVSGFYDTRNYGRGPNASAVKYLRVDRRAGRTTARNKRITSIFAF